MKRRTQLTILTLAGLALTALIIYVYTPVRDNNALKAICRVDAQSCYQLVTSHKDTLYLSLREDSLQAASTEAQEVTRDFSQSGVFVSQEGDIITSDGIVDKCEDTLSRTEVTTRLQQLDSITAEKQKGIQSVKNELDYYARTHTVIDDGYNDVMAYRERITERAAHIDSALAIIKRALNDTNSLNARLYVKAQYFCPTDTHRVNAHWQARIGGIVLLQSDSLRLPQGAHRLSVYRFGVRSIRRRLFAFNDLGSKSVNAMPEIVDSNKEASLFSAAEGGAYLNRSGHLCGIRRDNGRVGSRDIARLMRQVHCWPVWWWHNFTAWLRSWQSNTSVKTTTPPQRPLKTIRKVLADSTVYTGQIDYTKAGIRVGYGIMVLKNGDTFEGIWTNDSLKSGIRRNDKGVYTGTFSADWQAEGKGAMQYAKGEYYEGEWKANKRSGHGFSMSRHHTIRCGTWKNDLFQGEQMIYTSDRVYGIDISRHQHEKDGKKYSINWNNLRITGIGNGRRVRGAVDYPVSFMYIKSTEGRSIFNKYYPTDLRQARSHGIAVGTYHFFSTTSTGAQQAAYFLKMSWIAANDMPPVLDLEPTDEQIKKMGGDAVLFREALTWMRAVERKCGKRPVLYVGQQFVNKHLPKAPQEMRNYDVWIARYSEFKPFIHLLHWQLTPYGRVRGIHGEVDINVFNGSRNEFKKYRMNGTF